MIILPKSASIYNYITLSNTITSTINIYLIVRQYDRKIYIGIHYFLHFNCNNLYEYNSIGQKLCMIFSTNIIYLIMSTFSVNYMVNICNNEEHVISFKLLVDIEFECAKIIYYNYIKITIMV